MSKETKLELGSRWWAKDSNSIQTGSINEVIELENGDIKYHITGWGYLTAEEIREQFIPIIRTTKKEKSDLELEKKQNKFSDMCRGCIQPEEKNGLEICKGCQAFDGNEDLLNLSLYRKE
jgi:hypothetical protein